MKRLLSLGALAALLVAIPVFHVANAQKEIDEEDTVLICHVSGNDTNGKVIAVDDNAIAAHRAHGDCFVKCAIPGEDCACKIKPR